MQRVSRSIGVEALDPLAADDLGLDRSVWPSGWVCQAVRAPGSKGTVAPLNHAGSSALNGASIRAVPVK
jgi:hypothetical protein